MKSETNFYGCVPTSELSELPIFLEEQEMMEIEDFLRESKKEDKMQKLQILTLYNQVLREARELPLGVNIKIDKTDEGSKGIVIEYDVNISSHRKYEKKFCFPTQWDLESIKFLKDNGYPKELITKRIELSGYLIENPKLNIQNVKEYSTYFIEEENNNDRFHSFMIEENTKEGIKHHNVRVPLRFFDDEVDLKKGDKVVLSGYKRLYEYIDEKGDLKTYEFIESGKKIEKNKELKKVIDTNQVIKLSSSLKDMSESNEQIITSTQTTQMNRKVSANASQGNTKGLKDELGVFKNLKRRPLESLSEKGAFLKDLVSTWEYFAKKHEEGKTFYIPDTPEDRECLTSSVEIHSKKGAINLQFNGKNTDCSFSFDLTNEENFRLGASNYLKKNLKYTELFDETQISKSNSRGMSM